MGLTGLAGALLRLDTNRIAKGFKARWMDKIFPQDHDFRDDVGRFNRLYLVRDPWSLDRQSEKFRFEVTNRVIAENFDRPSSLLEVGCGEGLQSNELRHVCDRLYGIDVSGRAIKRAKRRCPQATFAVGDMYTLPQSIPLKRFDLVTAFEVLYYMADVAGALSRLSELGGACAVSYYDGEREMLDAHVRKISGVQVENISYEDTSWTLAWWRQ